VDTLQRSAPRTAPLRRLEVIGYALVAIGYLLITLGIFEIGGIFNGVLGLTAVVAGDLMMFRGGDLALDEEAFRRELEDL
jgi:hypothetical protein